MYIPFKSLLGGVKQLGYHPKDTTIFLWDTVRRTHPAKQLISRNIALRVPSRERAHIPTEGMFEVLRSGFPKEGYELLPRRVNILRYIKKSIPTFWWICLFFHFNQFDFLDALDNEKKLLPWEMLQTPCFLWCLEVDFGWLSSLQNYQLKPLKLDGWVR